MRAKAITLIKSLIQLRGMLINIWNKDKLFVLDINCLVNIQLLHLCIVIMVSLYKFQYFKHHYKLHCIAFATVIEPNLNYKRNSNSNFI